MKKNNLANLLSAVEKARKGSGSAEGDYFYYPERDKAGNATVEIRFLPSKSDDVLPFVKTYSHGFKTPQGKWFIEECPTTIGQPCPVCEDNTKHWNNGTDAGKQLARDRKRKTSHIANILVVKDTAHPENEGKVFLYKFGTKIFDMIYDQLSPQVVQGEDPREPVNVFDLEEGANFKWRIRVVDGMVNYDKSEFLDVSVIENAEEVMEQVNDIQKYIDPKSFKSHTDIAAKLARVLGTALPDPAPQTAGSSKVIEAASNDDPPFEPDNKPTTIVDKADEMDADEALFIKMMADAK